MALGVVFFAITVSCYSFAANRIALLRSEYTIALYSENLQWGDYDELHIEPAKLLLGELPFQYDVVSDYFIESDSLRILNYSLLIIPDAISLSPIECLNIEEFVISGGTVFMTGTSGIHDTFGWTQAFCLSAAMGVRWPGFEREISEGSFWNMNVTFSNDPQSDSVLKGVFEKNRINLEDTTETDTTENDISIKNGADDGAVVPIFLSTAQLLAYWTDYNLDSLAYDPRGQGNLACAITCNKFGNGYVIYFNGKLFSGYKYCRQIATWAHRDTDPCQNAEKIVFNVIRNFADTPISNLELSKWWMQWQHHERSRLVDSYEDGDQEFGHNVAFLYDQALAVMVYCALAKHNTTNAQSYQEKSQFILGRLSPRQNGDGSFYFSWIHKDEPLEVANRARFSGANAWLLMAINKYEEQFGDTLRYRGMATSLAAWLRSRLHPAGSDTQAVQGGINADDQELTFKSVEHNLDAYSALSYFGYLARDSISTGSAQRIRRWLEGVTWEDHEGHFLRGENDKVATMDVNPWGILALGDTAWQGYDFTRGLDWALKNCRTVHPWEGKWDPHRNLIGAVDGFDFNDDKDVVWVEGTESMALALHLAGKDSLADFFHKEMARLIPPANNGGRVYATNEGTIAADDDSRAATYPSVAGTAWYIFSELKYNPFKIPREAHPDPNTKYPVTRVLARDNGKQGDFHLFQNHPNPFNPTTTITFSLPGHSHALLQIFNSNGQVVRTLINSKQSAGYHEARWDGRNQTGQPVPSGVYFCRLKAGTNFQVKKMLLLR